MRKLFSDEERAVLPAFMDGLAVMICSLPFWAAWLATAKGHSLSELYQPSGLTIMTLAGYIIVGGGVSLCVIRATQGPLTPKDLRRSPLKTTIAIVFGVCFTVGFGMFIVGSYNLAGAWQAFATMGLTGVPAALRMTAPEPFEKSGLPDPDAMRAFGVEPGDGYDSRGWTQKP